MDQLVLATWLPGFVHPEYFTECHEHIQESASSKKCEKKFYCVVCAKGPLCVQSCRLEHYGHDVLKVRKAPYRDTIGVHTIRIDDISKFLNIEHIQTYCINRVKVVYLPSRPQDKPVKGFPSHCEICNRSLPDCVRFCSLSCKMKAIIKGPSDALLTFGSGGAAIQYSASAYQQRDQQPAMSGDHGIVKNGSSPSRTALPPQKKPRRLKIKGPSDPSLTFGSGGAAMQYSASADQQPAMSGDHGIVKTALPPKKKPRSLKMTQKFERLLEYVMLPEVDVQNKHGEEANSPTSVLSYPGHDQEQMDSSPPQQLLLEKANSPTSIPSPGHDQEQMGPSSPQQLLKISSGSGNQSSELVVQN